MDKSQPIDWAAVKSMTDLGYQRWLAMQQPAAPAGPAPGTPEIGRAAARALVPGAGRVPTTPPDRPALAKGADPAPSGGWDGDVPCVDIDTDDDEPVAKTPAPAPAAAAASSDPGPAAPAADAAAFAGLTRQQLAERLAEAEANLKQWETDYRLVEAQLAHSLIGAREQFEELRDVSAKNAGWRRRQVEITAEAEERNAEIRELQLFLAQCEEMLATARAKLASLIDHQ